jgi:hypothetical protein
LTKRKSTGAAAICADPYDSMVPDPVVFAEFGITPMTGWRWDHDPALSELGWPPPVKIRERKFRSRTQLERFKANMLRRALQQRSASRSR